MALLALACADTGADVGSDGTTDAAGTAEGSSSERDCPITDPLWEPCQGKAGELCRFRGGLCRCSGHMIISKRCVDGEWVVEQDGDCGPCWPEFCPASLPEGGDDCAADFIGTTCTYAPCRDGGAPVSAKCSASGWNLTDECDVESPFEDAAVDATPD